jgi:hypothetical protein
MHKAAGDGDVATIKRMLAEGVDVNVQGPQGVQPLHEAAYHGHVDAVRVLVEVGAEVEASDAGGATPLHTAAYQGHLALVKTLVLELGADKEAATATGYRPLHLALSRAALRRGWGHTASVCTYAMYLASSYAPQARVDKRCPPVTAPVLFGAQRPAAHRRARTPQNEKERQTGRCGWAGVYRSGRVVRSVSLSTEMRKALSHLRAWRRRSSSLPHTGRPLLGGSCPPRCGEGTLCSLAPSAPPQGLRPRATTLCGSGGLCGSGEDAGAGAGGPQRGF